MKRVIRNLFRLRPMERILVLGLVGVLLALCLWRAIPFGNEAEPPPNEKRSLQVP